jgi:predicted transporter
MQNLLILLVCVFASVALIVVFTERYGAASSNETTAKLQRWIMPLVGLLLVLGALDYFFGGG